MLLGEGARSCRPQAFLNTLEQLTSADLGIPKLPLGCQGLPAVRKCCTLCQGLTPPQRQTLWRPSLEASSRPPSCAGGASGWLSTKEPAQATGLSGISSTLARKAVASGGEEGSAFIFRYFIMPRRYCIAIPTSFKSSLALHLHPHPLDRTLCAFLSDQMLVQALRAHTCNPRGEAC